MSTQTNELPLPAAVRLQHPMAHHETQVVDLNGQALADGQYNEQAFGLAVPTVAKIEAGKQLFSVLDTRHYRGFSSPLVIVDESFRRDSKRGYKGVWEDELVLMGRGHHGNRFDYLPTVSGTHFALAYDGLGLVVTNQQPVNKTLLSGDLLGARQRNDRRAENVQDSFTARAHEDMRHRFDFGAEDMSAPYGYYKNHMIIGRGTATVKDGVYFTTRPSSEAVVVDDKSKAMRQIAQGILQKVERKFGQEPTVPLEYMLKLVNQYTRQVMPYDEKGADRLSEPHYRGNGLIGLSEYVQKGVGVCRHQCLVAAFLLETLVENQIILGRTGVERNHDVDVHGAHAWAIFETPSGQTYVVDPAQNFVGTKAKARQQGRWKYDLTADR